MVTFIMITDCYFGLDKLLIYNYFPKAHVLGRLGSLEFCHLQYV